MPKPGDLGRKAAEPRSPEANAQRDSKGRFASGHPKVGGRPPAREKAVTPTPEAGHQAASPSHGTHAGAAVRDDTGRFVRGHPKLGGRKPGSGNKHGRKAALAELMMVATNSEAEGQDPRVAVGGAVVKGLQTPRKRLGFVTAMMKHGMGPEKVDNGPGSSPDRRWLGFGKTRPPQGPQATAPRPERKGRALVVRDGGEEFIVVKDQATTTCRRCQGRGIFLLGWPRAPGRDVQAL
jgi:hypothetical protein